MELTRVLCLDLDGTVRRPKSGLAFPKDANDIELIPGVKEIMIHFKNLGYVLIGFTNQAGVAHGFKTYQQMVGEIDLTWSLCMDHGDPLFTQIYSCAADPKGKVEPHNYRSLHRKPDIGMLAKAEYDLLLIQVTPDWDNSLFVGGRPEDEECAKRAGIPFQHIDQFLKTQI